MGFALSRYSFHLGFFGAAAESRLGLAFRSMLDRMSWWRVDRSNIDRNQRKQQYHSSLDWVDVAEGDDLVEVYIHWCSEDPINNFLLSWSLSSPIATNQDFPTWCANGIYFPNKLYWCHLDIRLLTVMRGTTFVCNYIRNHNSRIMRKENELCFLFHSQNCHDNPDTEQFYTFLTYQHDLFKAFPELYIVYSIM